MDQSTIETTKGPSVRGPSVSSGGRIRTCDLRVMSPTSYQTAPPRGGLRSVAPPFGDFGYRTVMSIVISSWREQMMWYLPGTKSFLV
jgi:hypothetical protein